MESKHKPNRIAQRNDEFRKTTPEMSVTPGALALDSLAFILQKVRSYDNFSDNDPYEEHDFGVVEHEGDTACWKIDYYTQDLRGWEHPLSPACRRILTILLPDEY